MKKRETKKYIQMFSIHGLIRFNNPELGFDADTGGQIRYVLEEALELSKRSAVERVDLFTRQIRDKQVSEDYSVAIKVISKKLRIIRIQCGGFKYIRKEKLWPHLDEFIDKTIKFIKAENAIPDIIHGHYADGGYVAMYLAKLFGAPLMFTGHSLGITKQKKLLADGLSTAEINKQLNITHRIETEEEIIRSADLIITSTTNEIKQQYSLYENNNVAKYRVIPPGINIEKLYPYYYECQSEFKKDEVAIQSRQYQIEELNRFFLNPDKPLILALCRPDKKKNIDGLITAYGESKELQAIANLAIYAGIRKNIMDKDENEKQVLIDILLLMDKYDLYGKMAIPKKHDFVYAVPELYRIAASSSGVFVNIALTEPFGLTLIEASACGLPIVATNDGGPQDIIKNCQNGIIVNPLKTREIIKAITTIITDHDTWKKMSSNGIAGIQKHYTWEVHSRKYLREIDILKKGMPHIKIKKEYASEPIGKRMTRLGYFIFSDIDNTLIGDKPSLDKLKKLLLSYKTNIGFGVATGRTLESTMEVLKKNKIPIPDIIVCSVGSEIYYSQKLLVDTGWRAHISNKWNRSKIVELLGPLGFLELQEEEVQRPHKLSYFIDYKKDRLAKINNILLKNKMHYNLIFSHNRLIDILPYRASKGKAVRYLSYKWGIPLERIMVCGDSGNDEEMLRGEPLAVVVSNYSSELKGLRGMKNVFFSKKSYAAGILDGINNYGFLELPNR